MRRSGSVVALVMLMAVACGGGGDGDGDAARSGGSGSSRSDEATTTTTTAPEHDPPRELAADGVGIGTVSNGLYAVLDGAVYFVDAFDGALVATDLASGEPRWSLPVDDAFLGSWGSPGAAEVDGEPLVFATYGAVEAGTGTEADREALRVVALDPADGTARWTADVPTADIPEAAREDVLGAGAADTTPARVVAADGEHVVVSTDEGYRDAFTVVLDATSGDVVWAAPDFQALALGGDVVAGTIEHPDSSLPDLGQLAARAVGDGAPVWQAEDVFVPDDRTIRALGSDRLSVGGSDHTSGAIYPDRDVTHILAMGDGTVVTTLDGSHTCVDDGDATIVCDSGEHVVGLDHESGETLWQLPDDAAGRIAPRVNAARNGAVYTYTDGSGVILDARTGEDEVTDLPVSPTDVVPGYGLVLEDNSFGDDADLTVYPATG